MRSPLPALPVLVGIALLALVALGSSGEIRQRASAGLGMGMPEREAALARGFVLGEDEGVDERTEEDFRRAGLSHLLAVSGQNVTLLALLAMPLLGALGIPLRERLFWMLALIAVYVPVAGAGPSIQRAGVMGALGLLATLGGRRASRLYSLALAALVTLAIDPGVAADVGWQLSFAAVLGILLLASALPAVAPAMWLGMCAATLAQLPGVPLEPLNGLNALLLAYIAQVAEWCAAPRWAELRVDLDGQGLVLAYLGLGLALLVYRRWPRAVLAVAAVSIACWLPLPSLGGAAAGLPHGLRVTVLDVGQGDAILLQPADAAPVLVDGGPPGDGLARKLEEAGVRSLGAVVITHDESDHAGGVEERRRPAPGPSRNGSLPVANCAPGRCGCGFSGRPRSCLARRLLARTRTGWPW